MEYVITPWTAPAAQQSLCALVACRQLRKLKITDYFQTTCEEQDNLSMLFAAFLEVPNAINDLVLPNKLWVTKDTLHAVVAAFPNLHSLTMMGDVDRGALFSLLRAGKLTARRITLNAYNASRVSKRLIKHGMHHQLRRGVMLCFPLEHLLLAEPLTFNLRDPTVSDDEGDGDDPHAEDWTGTYNSDGER